MKELMAWLKQNPNLYYYNRAANKYEKRRFLQYKQGIFYFTKPNGEITTAATVKAEVVFYHEGFSITKGDVIIAYKYTKGSVFSY